jgi:hypothetical protein
MGRATSAIPRHAFNLSIAPPMRVF